MEKKYRVFALHENTMFGPRGDILGSPMEITFYYTNTHDSIEEAEEDIKYLMEKDAFFADKEYIILPVYIKSN